MDLKAWRNEQGLSQGQLGKALGFPAESCWSQTERIENGKIKVDADLIAAIERLTEGQVTAADMHKTRLDWLHASGKARPFASGAAA